MDAKREGSFAGVADIIAQANAASKHLKDVYAACAAGDKARVRLALRRAISELEIARAMLRPGHE